MSDVCREITAATRRAGVLLCSMLEVDGLFYSGCGHGHPQNFFQEGERIFKVTHAPPLFDNVMKGRGLVIIT